MAYCWNLKGSMKIFFHENKSLHLARKIVNCSLKWWALGNLQSAYTRKENPTPVITMPTNRTGQECRSGMGEFTIYRWDGFGCWPWCSSYLIEVAYPLVKKPILPQKQLRRFSLCWCFGTCSFYGAWPREKSSKVFVSPTLIHLSSLWSECFFLQVKEKTQKTLTCFCFHSNQSWPVQGSCSLIKPVQKLMLLNSCEVCGRMDVILLE